MRVSVDLWGWIGWVYYKHDILHAVYIEVQGTDMLPTMSLWQFMSAISSRLLPIMGPF
jgi:hypothetical protein